MLKNSSGKKKSSTRKINYSAAKKKLEGLIHLMIYK